MIKSKFRFLAPAVFAVAMLALAAPSHAVQGDCAVIVTNGDKPLASDCLGILQHAVSQTLCAPLDPCVCDADGSGTILASDALLCLNVAVGNQAFQLNCQCDGTTTTTTSSTTTTTLVTNGVPCTSAEFIALAGSDLDTGWTGIAFDSDVTEGASISFRVLRRCSNDQSVCETDADCTGGTCDATCDCINDKICEVTGPTHQQRCLTSLDPCSTNADCGGIACIYTFGPPLPLSSGNSSVCVVSVFDGELTGTANVETGESVASVGLKSRAFLGVNVDQPCPRCGPPDQNPKIGDTFNCEGGANGGSPCTVEALNPEFGGVSHDCPPDNGANISGQGLTIRFSEVKTGTVRKQATVPCAGPGFTFHPDNGFAFCLDNGSSCSSNSDCLRCDNDLSVCTDNNDCSAGASCLSAPDQPISCGRYCHCGFCDDDATQPCFDDGDCEPGSQCVTGSGTSTDPNAGQLQPNDCAQDFYVCGTGDKKETCENTFKGECNVKTWRACNSDAECQQVDGGDKCVIAFRGCFENRIERTGKPSPLGRYCKNDPNNTTPCSSNADCAGDDVCVDDASRPTSVALFCVPATSSPAVNSAGGTTGPGAISFNSFVKICRCGDGVAGCDEQCDDGNLTNGDGCSDRCVIE